MPKIQSVEMIYFCDP